MISPVQRIPRYQLYLKDLLKHSRKGNQSYKNYKICLEKVQKVLTEINSQMKEGEKYIKPSIDLKKLAENRSIDLSSLNLLAEYDMYMINAEIKPNNKTKYKVFVFTTLLVILKKKFM